MKFSRQDGVALPAALLADGAHAMPNACLTLLNRGLRSTRSAYSLHACAVWHEKGDPWQWDLQMCK